MSAEPKDYADPFLPDAEWMERTTHLIRKNTDWQIPKTPIERWLDFVTEAHSNHRFKAQAQDAIRKLQARVRELEARERAAITQPMETDDAG